MRICIQSGNFDVDLNAVHLTASCHESLFYIFCGCIFSPLMTHIVCLFCVVCELNIVETQTELEIDIFSHKILKLDSFLSSKNENVSRRVKAEQQQQKIYRFFMIIFLRNEWIRS